MADIDTILRLVAEGALTAEEAERLIDALGGGTAGDAADAEADRRGRLGAAARAYEAAERARGAAERVRARLETARMEVRSPDPGQRYLRIEVTEAGRRVVNFRVPLGIAGAAAALVPGLGSSHAERIREAIRSGIVGPIIDVEDGGDRVVISAE